MKWMNITLSNRQIVILEWILILVASLSPLFFNQSYSANIYLSWEGAYRLYLGQIPYKDFGLPMGFGLWLIPGLFFKIFGPYLSTLIKAQALINILSALAFRSILKQVKVKSEIRLLSLLLYIVSFSYFNLWPWYNHSVIVFEFIGIALLLKYILNEKKKNALITLFCSTFFLFLSFFTKQDAGAITFMIAFALMICHAIYERKGWSILWFLLFYTFFGLCFFLPFIRYNIGYWFNYGQAPHSARMSMFDLLNSFFGGSEWIKFYLLVILLLWMVKFRNFRQTLQDKTFVVFSLLVIAVIFEAVVIQVTSFTSPFNNIFFHSFAIVYIFSLSGLSEKINFKRIGLLLLTGLAILTWWSPSFWAHAAGPVSQFLPQVRATDTNEISIHTFQRPDPHKTWKTSLTADQSKWKSAPWEAFKNISMPEPTIAGMKRLTENYLIKDNGKNLKVLNMTELTPLAEVIGYIPETGMDIPLWYHKNVGIFEKQIKEYDRKISDNYYDLVLFEYIPILNNFFPFEIRDSLKAHYQQIDSFPAPRDKFYKIVEVYTKKPVP